MKNSKSMIILLVTLSLLTLVVVVGLFFFYPKESQPVAPTPVATPATPLPDEFDPVEWTRNPQTPSLQTPTITGDQGFTVTLPPEGGTTLPPSPGATFPSEVTSTPVTSPSGTPNASPAPLAPVKAPVSKAPTPATTPAPKPAPTPAPKPAPKTVRVTEYWIQVASFKDRYQAENTAKSLETQGLKGTLSTATVNGQSVVRVRVGPYTNEAEAQKFLSWLTPVQEFSASYVTKVQTTRTAP